MPRAPEKGVMERSPFYKQKQAEAERLEKERAAKSAERAEITGDGVQEPVFPGFQGSETRAVPRRVPKPPAKKKD